MPVVSAATPAAEVVLRYRAGEQRLAIGGDFADALALADGRIATIIGDVSGPRARRRRDGRHAARGLARARAARRRRSTRLPQAPAGAAAGRAAVAGDLRHGLLRASCRPTGASSSSASAGHPPPLAARRRGRPRAEPGDLRAAARRRCRARRGRTLARRARARGVRAAVQRRADRGALGAGDARRLRRSPACRRSWRGLAAVAPFAPGHVLDAALAHATAAHGEELPDDVAMLLLTPRTPPAVAVRLRRDGRACRGDARDRRPRGAGAPACRAAADRRRAARRAPRRAPTSCPTPTTRRRRTPARTMLFEVRADGRRPVRRRWPTGRRHRRPRGHVGRRPRPAADAPPGDGASTIETGPAGHARRAALRPARLPAQMPRSRARSASTAVTSAGRRRRRARAPRCLLAHQAAPRARGLALGLDQLAEALQVGLHAAVVDARAPSRWSRSRPRSRTRSRR